MTLDHTDSYNNKFRRWSADLSRTPQTRAKMNSHQVYVGGDVVSSYFGNGNGWNKA